MLKSKSTDKRISAFMLKSSVFKSSIPTEIKRAQLIGFSVSNKDFTQKFSLYFLRSLDTIITNINEGSISAIVATIEPKTPAVFSPA